MFKDVKNPFVYPQASYSDFAFNTAAYMRIPDKSIPVELYPPAMIDSMTSLVEDVQSWIENSFISREKFKYWVIFPWKMRPIS